MEQDVKLNLAIIGCGTKATQYIQTWIVRDDVQISAIMDPNPVAMDNVLQIAAKAGQTAPVCFSSWQTLLHDQHQQLDAVYICTPHASHAEQALLALELGLDVLLEKPMVTTVAEAEALVAAQQQSGKTLVVAYQGGLSPLVNELKDAIANQTYGKLVSINAAIWEDWADKYQGHWKQVPAISGGGFMFDTGAHMMNTVSKITSQPFSRISAIMHNHGFPVDVVTTVAGELSDGTLFNLHACGRSIRCVSRIECYFPSAIVRICAWGRWMEIEDAQGNVVRKEQEAANNLLNVFMQTRMGAIANPSDVHQGLRMAAESSLCGGQGRICNSSHG